MKKAAKRKYHAPTGSTAMEDLFIEQIKNILPECRTFREVTPDSFGKRKFRIDVMVRLADPLDVYQRPKDYVWVEIQGGSHRGAHATVKGRTRDAEKLALAHFSGVPLFHFTSPMVRDGRGASIVAAYLLGQDAPGVLSDPPRTRRRRKT